MKKCLPGKIYITVLITLISCQVSFSQNEGKIWYFGNQAGLDFNSGSPVALTNGVLSSTDCSSSISDASGSILFYTNGMTVWNRNHVVMANGSGLLGGNSAGQTALIVPQPYTSMYYIFTVDNFAGSNGFRYHIVDISQNAGLGAVTSLNNLLFSPSTERIDAIFNPSDQSYWIVTHHWNSNEFCSYKLSSTGLNTTPVLSAVGTVHSGGSPNGYNALGQLTISPLGDMLACAICSSGIFEVFDFNRITGVVSNPRTINGYPNAWGTAFSPDESRLYVTRWYGQDIFQFDLNAGTWTNVINSVTVVGTVTGPGTFGYYVGYLQLAPNNKIYAAVWDDSSLAVINNPNGLGNACSFVDNGMYLGGKLSSAGLCRTIPVYSEGKNTGIESTDVSESLVISPNPNAGSFNLSLRNNSRNKNSLKIYSLTGEVIYEANSINDSSIKVELKNQKPGIYFLRVTNDEHSFVKKIVVLSGKN